MVIVIIRLLVKAAVWRFGLPFERWIHFWDSIIHLVGSSQSLTYLLVLFHNSLLESMVV